MLFTIGKKNLVVSLRYDPTLTSLNSRIHKGSLFSATFNFDLYLFKRFRQTEHNEHNFFRDLYEAHCTITLANMHILCVQEVVTHFIE